MQQNQPGLPPIGPVGKPVRLKVPQSERSMQRMKLMSGPNACRKPAAHGNNTGSPDAHILTGIPVMSDST